jgi:hypothetical protein
MDVLASIVGGVPVAPSDCVGAPVPYDAWAPTLASSLWYVAGMVVGFLVGRWEQKK